MSATPTITEETQTSITTKLSGRPTMHIIVLRKPVVLTEEQERNPPSLPLLTLRSALYAQIRRFSLLGAKPLPVPTPAPVNPKMLETADIPETLDTSPIVRLPKGPAPTIPKKRRRSSCASTDPALCPGW
ncbi:hypothetical protein C8J57DRAFT_1214093 [Mycena rebaudengoi]|nr:hypothetical protein C8J57DRAFT_1214093 [Mycena rebaudengoi]